MDEKIDKANIYSQDMILERQSISNKIYNYFYTMLKEKKEISLLEIYILYILETIQLISYGLSEPHITTWKEKSSTLKNISDIISISRITTLMKYIKFDIYIIIFFIIVVIIFCFFIFLILNILFFKESKFFVYSVSIIRNFIYPLSIFLFIPLTELLLLPLKCNIENKVDIVKSGIECWNNIHYLYSILGIIFSILFFSCMLFLTYFFFYPFNYRASTIRINSTNDSIFLFFKFIFVLRFILVKNEYLSIAILFILTLYIMKQEFFDHSFNNNKIEIFINIKYFLAFWTYFILIFAKFFDDTKINGLIYILISGFPFIIIFCISLVNKYKYHIDYTLENNGNLNEYLKKTKSLLKLITSFIEGSKVIRFGVESENQKEDTILKGIIKIHTLKCLKEECPLTKFIQKLGNYNAQKQCLINYMNIYFTQGIKKFPFSNELKLYNIYFNYSNRINLNSVKTNISLLQNTPNTIRLKFIIYKLSKDIKNMKSENVNGDSSYYEQENEILNQKYRRLKYLIENCNKLYGEFWGIFATNVTNNLNTFKLYNLGQKLNNYLEEINYLWDNELKMKKVNSENEMIIQLYSRFLREILWNKKKSEEISNKLNNLNHNHDLKKIEKSKKEGGIGLESELEKPDYIIYSASNEKGESFISQCSSSISNLLGYIKNEIIGKRIEILMPELFKAKYADMLSQKIKDILGKQKTEGNSERENNKNSSLMVFKNKMGYLIPFNVKNTISEDTDFSNNFIIKTYLEAKDSKSVYAYYILTKSDFTICNMSSSVINLGLSNDILNKYVINIDFLIRDKNLQAIDFINKVNEYQEELKEVIWIYPFLIYPKEKMNNELNEEDLPELIISSPKKKVLIQLSVMKFGASDILGYLFKIIDINTKKKNSTFELEKFIPTGNKEILFDLLNLNYIRTEIVSKKSGNKNLRNNEETLVENSQQKNKLNKEKITNTKFEDEIIESSEDDNKNPEIELTKEKIMEMQTRNSQEIENFINKLPYYGEDVFLEKHRPNKEKFAVGKGHEALIKISIGKFITRIEQKINSNNPELTKKYKVTNATPSPNKDFKNREFSSDTSNFLANIFKTNIIFYIKVTSLIFFLIFLLILVFEFIFTFTNVNKIKDSISKMRNAYKLLEDIGFIKYCTTEIVLCATFGQPYIILVGYNMTLKDDIIWLQDELGVLSEDFRNVLDQFSISLLTGYSKEYQELISNDTQVLIYTLINGKEETQNLSFTSAINRIPSTIFHVSTISESDTNILNLNERNLYELMVNLLNGYYIYVKKLSLILAQGALDSAKNSIVGNITFYLSFVFAIIFLIIIWYLLFYLMIERQRPINLFLTIKKQIFEDLKNSSESFSNKLLNKLIGNEDNEEENQKDYNANIKDSDINIVKFKAFSDYKTKGKSNKEQLHDYIKLIIFFIFIQVYIIFKFFYSRNNIENVKKFLDVFNITYYSFVDIIINIDLSKQFIYNRTMPIFYYKNNERGIDKESAFYTTFYNITNSFEEMIIKTSNTNSFLKNSYRETFTTFLYHNFSNEVFIDTEYMPNLKLLGLLSSGFIPVVNNIFEKLRFVWIECYDNKANTINDLRWCDIDYLVLYIVKPWYKEIIEIMHNEANKFLNDSKVVQISLFIIVIVVFILSYFILWKSYEERLTLMLYRSFDLIKLIPEEIKYIIVSKLNE